MPLRTHLTAALLAAAPLSAQTRRAAAPAPVVVPAAREFAHKETIWMGFHEPSGYGSVELRPMRVAAEPALTLKAMFVFKGRALAAPPKEVSVALTSATADRFPAAPELVFTLDDGTRVPFGATFRQPGSEGGGPTETLALRVPVRTFLKLLGAARATGRVGGAEFTLEAEQLEALRDLASRMEPAAHAKALAAATATFTAPGFTIKKDYYEPAEVDRKAAPSVYQVKPGYPAAVTGAERTVRSIFVEFVVDTTGRVDMATMRGMSPNDGPFMAVLRVAAERWEYTPATKDGKPVRQLVRQAFLFEP